MNEQPVIDWELGLKLAGNNREIAEELLDMLAATLASDIKQIQDLYEKKNCKELAEKLHRLHGAVSYCGVPRLKKILATLEVAVKQNKMDTLPELLEILHHESQLLLEAMQNLK